ncbi:protein quirky [Quercus suber]|uniref:Protein quirky n=1 Tax=Quercus suber TaxID=58331 RepID=A0AAW0JV72_QUESU
MAESCGRKLVVEVCNAKNLMPKDGQGTASAYAIVDFDGQRRRTKTKFRDLNPEWDEKLEFMVQDKETMESEMLEINLYNDKKTGKRSNFLGKVKMAGTTFAKSSSEAIVYYPLEKRSVFSQIKGELGLKVYYIDENPGPAAAEEEKKPPTEEEKTKMEEKVEAVPEKEEEKKTEEEEEKPKEEAAAAAKEQEEAPKPEEVHSEKKQQQQQTNNKENLKSESGDVVVVGGLNEAELLRSLRSGRSRSGSADDDLVDRMPFLYVRVVKVKVKSEESVAPSSSCFYAKLVIGTHGIKTNKSQSDKDWDQVFAFDKEGLNSTSLELSVYRADEISGSDAESCCCLGTVSFDLQEVPKRVPPDSPLAPQWYTLDLESENPSSGSGGNDVMLAVWFGTQSDEAFQEAWQSDSGGLIPETRAKVYLSPKLWYLRLTVIQTQDLQLQQLSEPINNNNNKVRSPDNYYVVKAQLGAQVFKTCRSRTSGSSANNPTWNEDLVFVAAEPFEPFLVVTVEDVSNGQQSSSVGHAKIQVSSIERRIDDHTDPKSRWFNLVGGGDGGSSYTGRIHVRVCLEGGYHVLDEAAHVTSDVRASSKQLAKPPIGLLEVGIRGAANLLPVKTKDNGTRGTTDAYVVAKYGPKWVRTRTILDRFSPRWNEQYTWDVYDPCTVLTIGVFDNGRYKSKSEKDVRIGKIRVRLSTLDSNRIYINSYTLTVLLPNGANKMGEIEIAVRFTCPSWLSLIQAYTCPMLPRMHYVRPMAIALCPNLVLPTVFMFAFLIILLRFRYRQRVPLNIDTRLSYVEAVSLDELDEEFDGFPTTRSPEQVRIRYDRLRALAGRAQILLGDVAAQGERLEALFSWKDPRATGIFVVFCLFASLMFYAVPFKAFVLVSGFYYLRHPSFRHDMPSIPVNVFKRLPSLSDQIM